MSAHPRFIGLLLIAVLVAGCGKKHTFPVGGKVTYQKQPLAGATVTFIALGKHEGTVPIASAVTDGEGRFSLLTRAGFTKAEAGAVPGEHRVVISKFVPPDGMSEEEYAAKAEKLAELSAKKPGASMPPKIEMLPAKYSDTAKATLSATVKTDAVNEFQFDLE